MSTEAMKLALEALEGIHPGNMTPMAEEYWNKAITALQEALAQPQQEPVAWAISYDGETPYAIWPDGDGALLDLEVKRQGGTTCKLPLYISAPAQEFTCSTGLCHYRKPLTDEQVSAIWKAVPNQALYEAVMVFARAIEAAHGIKGDA